MYFLFAIFVAINFFIAASEDLNVNLYLAVCDGKVEEVKKWIIHGANVNSLIDGHAPVLHKATYLNHSKVVQTLLENKADPNIIDRGGSGTALHFATMSLRFDIAQMLIEYKADPNIKDDLENSPFYYALKYKCHKTIDLFLNNGISESTVKNALLAYTQNSEINEQNEDIIGKLGNRLINDPTKSFYFMNTGKKFRK